MNAPLLSIRKVGKTYYRKGLPPREALKDATIDLFSGEVIALLGVNGDGKTTLSSIIASLHPPTTGDLIWNGKSIYKDLFNYRKVIGFCPQHPNIDPTLTIEENLLFAGRCFGLSKVEAEERKALLMERFG